MSSPTLAVETLTRADDLRLPNDDWISLCIHPEAHPRFIDAVCTSDPSVVRPHVVLARKNGQAVGLAVARIERAPVPIAFGPMALLSPHMRVLRLSYQGVAGADDPDVLSALWDGLSAPLRNGEADALIFDHIAVGSSLDNLSASPLGGVLRDLSPRKESVHWVLDLPPSYEDYLAARSKNMRHNIKRTKKRVEELGDRLEVKTYSAPTDFARIAADSEAIAKLTYHRKLGVGFSDAPRDLALLRAGLEIGAFRADILYVDGEPKAFWHVLQWHRCRHTTHTGYDPGLSKLNIGTYLLQRLIAESCDDPATDRIDFGFGHAPYKLEVCNRNWSEVSRIVFARRLGTAGLNLSRGGAGHLATGSDRLLTRMGVRDKVKSIWRKKAVSAGKPER
jgi:Acetyltransferase (GNAT) domain